MSINKLPASIPVEKTIKNFHFTDETDIIDVSCSSSDSLLSESDQHVCNNNCLLLRVKEAPHPSFGMYVWPSAPVLGKYMWHNRNRLKGKITLELGSGTGLISVVAAKCGAHAILTDSKKYDSVFKIAEENMRLNDVDCENFEIQELTWGYITPFMVKSGQIHFILGSDVFYCPKDFEDIIVTVSYLLKKNPDAEFWCAYENRCLDLAPLNFHLFEPLKETLRDRRFDSGVDVWDAVQKWLHNQPNTFYQEGIRKFVAHWTKNIALVLTGKFDHLLKKWDLSCKGIPLEDFGADRFNIAGHDLPGLKTINLYIFTYRQTEP
ncbi:methyltransferase-like protein 23 [Trichonephila inaurata madagascariensis]|uniref:Methyltransferase-like protein 23 n=1 Tax=Trichonephila inaurata madagascariensis TaxID=2747483 RepID=A0A8X7BNM8_9ARAC|nr:methyltransferase-like protein 23 [Trichonephila inaurata madagascariensis]